MQCRAWVRLREQADKRASEVSEGVGMGNERGSLCCTLEAQDKRASVLLAMIKREPWAS